LTRLFPAEVDEGVVLAAVSDEDDDDESELEDAHDELALLVFTFSPSCCVCCAK
jgi:hypothetical protein